MVQCQNCGAHCTEKFARIFGDRSNAVESCFSCGTRGTIRHGKAAGKELPDVVDRIECLPKGHRVDVEVSND